LTSAILLALPGLGLLVGGFAAIMLVGARPVSGVDDLGLVGFGLGGLLLAGVCRPGSRMGCTSGGCA
jgi:hypothetical protein